MPPRPRGCTRNRPPDEHRGLVPSAWRVSGGCGARGRVVRARRERRRPAVGCRPKFRGRSIRVSRPNGPPSSAEFRGWASVEYDRSLLKNVDFSGDVVVYGSNGRRALVDGEAKVVWRGAEGRAGGRSPSRTLGTLHRLPARPARPGQHAVLAGRSRESLQSAGDPGHGVLRWRFSVDVYALIGSRRAAAPRERRPLRLRRRDRTMCSARRPGQSGARRPRLGHGADARLGGPCLWRPQPPADLRPAFTADARLAGVDAVYTEILQVGGEAGDDARGLALPRRGLRPPRRARRDRTRTGPTAMSPRAAEYQRLGAFGGAYNLIPRFEFMADTRGDRADIPFASARARRHADRDDPAPARAGRHGVLRTTGRSAATGSWRQSRKRSPSRRR